MPNGDPNWHIKEFPELEQFFSQISDVLESFSKKHNLMIDKYYHQGNDWTFRFKHPKGGIGQIFVVRLDQENVGVAASWHLDNYDKLTRYLKDIPIKKCPLNHIKLSNFLEDTFKIIISWKIDVLSPIKTKYKNWKKYSKELIEGDANKYPIPKI